MARLTLDMDRYQQVRRLYAVEKLSQRQIAKMLHMSRKTVAKYCQGGTTPNTEQKPRSWAPDTPLRQAVVPIILEYLEGNRDAHRKQQLTAKRIWELLCKEKGFAIGESTVRRIVRELKAEATEVFIPLQFDPGEAMQVDWGDIYVYMNGVKTAVSVFCAVLPFSYAIFAAVFPNKATESFFLGHRMAFEFFNGVPLKCIYDNLKTAVFNGTGKNAIKQEEFKRLEAHYAFEAVFCNAAAGWEKGDVENLVGTVREIAFSPMPRVSSYQELQEKVTMKCLEYCNTHRIRGRNMSVKDALEEERKSLLPLPAVPLDVAKTVLANVHSDSTIRFDSNRYSVPCTLGGQTLTVKATPFEVMIYSRGQLVAKHKRTYERDDPQYQPDHYLELLEQRPRAVMNAAPLKKGVWPKELEEFKSKYQGKDVNAQLVAILTLTKTTPKEKVLWAVNMANQSGNPSLELVCFYLDFPKEPQQKTIPGLEVDEVDLSAYDRLMRGEGRKPSGGGDDK